jgi:hypothetical protein
MPIVVNKDEKVKEICLRAYDEFTQKGIEGFSLNKFVSTTNFSKGQFYHYFKTKDELVFEVMSQKTLELIELYDSYLDSVNGLFEKLLAFFSFYLDDSEESVKLRKLMFDSYHIYIHSKDKKVKTYNYDLYKWIDEKLYEIFQKEGFDNVSLTFIKSISATADGMYFRSLMIDEFNLQSELTEYLENIIQMVKKET